MRLHTVTPGMERVTYSLAAKSHTIFLFESIVFFLIIPSEGTINQTLFLLFYFVRVSSRNVREPTVL